MADHDPIEGSSIDDDSSSGGGSYFSSVLFGLFLVCASSFAIFAIEQAATKFSLLMKRCQMACRMITDITRIDPDYEDRPVCVRGKTKLHGAAKANKDADTGFSVSIGDQKNALRLKRVAEMYQWVEERKERKSGKHRETYYEYHLKWAEKDQDSSQFHATHGAGDSYGRGDISYHDSTSSTYSNPKRNPPFESQIVDAEVTVGAYILSKRQVKMMEKFEQCPITNSNMQFNKVDRQIPTPNLETAAEIAYLVYKPANAGPRCSLESPEVGLVRISYQVIFENGPCCTVGVQKEPSFRAFTEQDAHRGMPNNCMEVASSATGYTAVRGDVEMGAVAGGDDDDDRDDEDDLNDTLDGIRQSTNNGNNPCLMMCCAPCYLSVLVQPFLRMCIGKAIGDDVLLLEQNETEGNVMFSNAQWAFGWRLNIMRMFGILFMYFGMLLLFSPIADILSWIPWIGTYVASFFYGVIGVLAIIIAAFLIASAWIAFHPEYLLVVLLTMGVPCILYATDTAWLYFGYMCCVGALYPLYQFVALIVEERAFAAEQSRKDAIHRQHVRERKNNGNMSATAKTKLVN